MSKRTLLICFDAFGTLFTPKRPVHVQYAEVAQSLGLGPFREGSVKASFGKAFKDEAKRNPNFGKANGMNAEQWWSNIIRNTFQPLIGSDQLLPNELVPKLLHRFWSKDGYDLMPDVQLLFQKLRSRSKARETGGLIVGVVTNSDDRVPDILTSLRLRVSPLRYGDDIKAALPDSKNDIDFSVMSFDVGHEKPDPRIFHAAECMLAHLIPDRKNSTAERGASVEKIYVGDEHSKDVEGAVNAGWNAVLIAPYEEVARHSDVKWLDEQPAGNIFEEFQSYRAVSFSRLGKLADWLPEIH